MTLQYQESCNVYCRYRAWIYSGLTVEIEGISGMEIDKVFPHQKNTDVMFLLCGFVSFSRNKSADLYVM